MLFCLYYTIGTSLLLIHELLGLTQAEIIPTTTSSKTLNNAKNDNLFCRCVSQGKACFSKFLTRKYSKSVSVIITLHLIFVVQSWLALTNITSKFPSRMLNRVRQYSPVLSVARWVQFLLVNQSESLTNLKFNRTSKLNFT